MSNSSLSPAQTDYIIARTNERGAANTPAVQYVLHLLTVGDHAELYLSIVGALVSDPAVGHGYTRKITLDSADVSDAFKKDVDKVIDGMLRHF